MDVHTQFYLWVIGIVATVVCTGVPVLFYVLSLKVKSDIISENKDLRKDLSDIRVEMVRKMGDTHTCNEVMSEKMRTLEVRVGHIETNLERMHLRIDAMAIQMTRLLSQTLPGIGKVLEQLMPEPAGGD